MTLDDIVVEVMKNYPEEKWIQEIKKRREGASIDLILSYLTAYTGGDVIALDEE